jgi:hypothetical protein
MTSGRVFCNTPICGKWSWWSLWIFQYFLARYLSYPVSLQLGWYTVLTRNNSSWVFSEPEKQVCRYTMASRRKLFIFLHVVKEEQRGVIDIWCTSGLRRVRRDPSITRGGLDADQWCVRLSMRSPTVYGKKICAAERGARGWKIAPSPHLNMAPTSEREPKIE